jgi:mannose-6-phosphate isomerase-like protein (cupin superfamily)
MPFDPGPFDITTTRVILGPQGNAIPKTVTPNFYEELDSEFNDFAGHLLISKHEFDEAWPTWEMHPKGDEVVYLLFGDVDFVLWTQEGEKNVRVNQPGSYVVVPKGTWHTARPRMPTGMLFVTPGEGTENAGTPGAARVL